MTPAQIEEIARLLPDDKARYKLFDYYLLGLPQNCRIAVAGKLGLYTGAEAARLTGYSRRHLYRGSVYQPTRLAGRTWYRVG